MNVLQAIQYIIQGWNEVTVETIRNCWHHTKILPNTEHLDGIEADDDNKADNDTETDDDAKADDIEANDLVLNEISKMLEILNLPNSMDVKELLNIPEENIIYEIPEDDQIVAELIEIFKKKPDENTNDLNEIDDSTEIETVKPSVALKCLTSVHTFLLQQENADECVKLVNILEKFIRNRQTQTTINQFFSK